MYGEREMKHLLLLTVLICACDPPPPATPTVDVVGYFGRYHDEIYAQCIEGYKFVILERSNTPATQIFDSQGHGIPCAEKSP